MYLGTQLNTESDDATTAAAAAAFVRKKSAKNIKIE